MSNVSRFTLTLLTVCLAVTPLGAQEIYLEPEDDVDALKYCDTVHRVGVCETFHFVPDTTTNPGSLVRLDDALYVITWIGPGYYLESGEVLHPLDGDSIPGLLVGQRWVEIYPEEGKIHVSRSWLDSNADGALSRSDLLELETGFRAKVRDVRLNLRVRPADIE